MGYAFHNPNVVAYYPNRSTTPIQWSREPWKMAQISRPSTTMAMSEMDALNFGGFLSAWSEDVTWGNETDLDWDGDGALDTKLKFLNDGRFEVPYGNLAPRHTGRTVNLNFLDGHAETMPISQMMKRPEENNNLSGLELLFRIYPE